MLDVFPLLLADVDIPKVISILMGLAMLVIWVVKQIGEANKPGPAPRARPASAPPKPVAQAGGPAQAAAGQQADPLRNQVEEFLRRAGRGAQGNAPRPQPPRARPPEPAEIEILLDDRDAAPPERRPLAEPLRPIESSDPRAMPQPTAAEPRRVRALRPAQPRHETVAEHVAETIGAHSRSVGDHASRLGQQIIEDDHQFDVQLKAKFDHTVGTLTGSAVTAAERVAEDARAADTPAAHIAAMLASPEGVRQAIVINEILRRPIDRW